MDRPTDHKEKFAASTLRVSLRMRSVVLHLLGISMMLLAILFYQGVA